MKSKSTEPKPKKAIFKRWWFWAIIIFILLLSVTSGGAKDGADAAVKDAESNSSSAVSAEPSAEPTAEPVSSTTEEETSADSTPADSAAEESELDKIVSFSAKDVRNDVTGKWRISVIAENINMEDYALDYYKEYFKSDDEIHGIVNFNYNTTTKISVLGNYIDVSVYEYLDGEEHDAKLLFGGMLLSESLIDKDTGEIQKIQ